MRATAMYELCDSCQTTEALEAGAVLLLAAQHQE
jgi:hypothetical protein